MPLSQKQEIFSEFFFHFGNLHLIFNIFQKKKNLIVDLFPKLRTAKKLFK